MTRRSSFIHAASLATAFTLCACSEPEFADSAEDEVGAAAQTQPLVAPPRQPSRPSTPPPPKPCQPSRGRACPPPPTCGAPDAGDDAGSASDGGVAEAAVDAGGGGDAALPEAGTDAGGAQDAGERACDGPSGCLIGTIPVSARDIVHDAKRDLLYITTSPSIGGDGSVLRWDLAQSRFLDPLLSGGQFLGIDLSPDQKLLAIADGAADGSSNWVHLIDLETGSRRKLSFTLDFYEAGTYTVVFLSDSTLLVSSSFAGSGWTPLRKVDLVTGEAQSVRSVRQGTMLALSADGSAVAYAESNEIPGTFGRYDPATGGIGGTTVPWFVYEACISRDAKQLATPTYGGTYVFDAQFTPLATIGLYADKMPIGCVYSPVADRLYFAWMSFDAQQPSLDVYDTKTLTRVRPIDPNIGLFDWVGNGAFNQGRLRMSRDGSLLFSTQRARVGIYRVAGGA